MTKRRRKLWTRPLAPWQIDYLQRKRRERERDQERALALWARQCPCPICNSQDCPLKK